MLFRSIRPQSTHGIFPVWTLFVSAGYAFANWYKECANPAQRKRFLCHCNAWNLVVSGLYLSAAWVLSQTAPAWLPWLVGFAAWRFVSRCLEIAYAFGLDVLKPRQNRSGLGKYERLKLALFSYAELYLLAAGLYLSTPFVYGVETGYQPFRAVIASLSVGSLTNVAYVVGEMPNAWQLLPFLQVFATLSLVVLSLAVYVSRPDEALGYESSASHNGLSGRAAGSGELSSTVVVGIAEAEVAPQESKFVGPPAPADKPATKEPSWREMDAWMKRLGAGVGFLLKLSPLTLLPPAFALWLYLREIQAPFFFLSSVASSTGLMVLFWIGVVIFGGLLYLFIVPSLLLMTVAGVYRDGTMLPKKIGILVLCQAAVCFPFLASSFWFPKEEHLGLMIFFGSLIACLLVLVVFRPSLVKGILSEGWGREVLMGIGGWLSPWLACMVTTLPFAVVLGFVGSGEMGGMDVKRALVILLFFSMLFSLVPGTMYLMSRSISMSTARAFRQFLAGVLGVLIGGALLYPYFFPTIGFIALRKAGVFETDEAIFQLSTADFVANPPLAKLAAFKPEGNEAAKGDAIRVKAYLRYSFGDVVWLCSESFDPLNGLEESTFGFSNTTM